MTDGKCIETLFTFPITKSSLFPGGLSSNGNERSVETLDLSSPDATWTPGTALPKPIVGASLIRDNDGGLVLVGGNENADVYKYEGQVWVRQDGIALENRNR